MSQIILMLNQQLLSLPVINPLSQWSAQTAHNDYAHGLPLGGEEGITIYSNTEGNTLRLSSESRQVKKVIKGDWDRELKTPSLFSADHFSFIVVPGPWELPTQAFKDWDFEAMPKDPRKSDYVEQILDYLLNSLELRQGAIFHRLGDGLRLLGQKDLKLKDHSAFVLQSYLERHEERPLLKMNFETHTLLFQAGLEPKNFYLIRTFLDEGEGEIILYIPEPQKELVPEGLLTCMLSLMGQGLFLSLAYQLKRRNDRKNLPDGRGYFWGNSQQMQRIQEVAKKLLNTNFSILITGETGTGKEGLAEYFSQGLNPGMPFVALNCASIPLNLAESVLFGHEKGAFTGAVKSEPGKLAQAQGGILFLDEIGELDLNIQAKLLRFLQTGVVAPIGGREQKLKLRVIAATHRDLLELIAQGKFREDLYYRLNEITLNLPPLRERRDDIVPLAQFFLSEVVQSNQLDPRVLSISAQNFLRLYEFPGNIRELKALIRRCAILSESELLSAEDIQCLGLGPTSAATYAHYPQDLAAAKKLFIQRHIQQVIESAQGNKTQAAKLLGIAPRSLFRFLAQDEAIEGQESLNHDSAIL